MSRTSIETTSLKPVWPSVVVYAGKSTLLWYMLIRFIPQAREDPVLICWRKDHILLFHSGKVFTPLDILQGFSMHLVPEHPAGRQVLALVDMDDSDTEYIQGLIGGPVFLVQAASPNPARYKNWVKQRKAAVWGLPLWTPHELREGSVVHLASVEINQRFSIFSAFASSMDIMPLSNGCKRGSTIHPPHSPQSR